MPAINVLQNNYSNYLSTTWSSDWIFVGDITSLTLSFLCSSNCSLGISYAVDIKYDVIYQESESIGANISLEIINKLVKTRYIKIDITGITVGSDLLTQGFYHV